MIGTLLALNLSPGVSKYGGLGVLKRREKDGCLLFIVDSESEARDIMKELSCGWLLGKRYVHQRRTMYIEPVKCANQNLILES